jgi:hypothetical protein
MVVISLLWLRPSFFHHQTSKIVLSSFLLFVIIYRTSWYWTSINNFLSIRKNKLYMNQTKYYPMNVYKLFGCCITYSLHINITCLCPETIFIAFEVHQKPLLVTETIFISKFWKELFKWLGTTLDFSKFISPIN